LAQQNTPDPNKDITSSRPNTAPKQPDGSPQNQAAKVTTKSAKPSDAKAPTTKSFATTTPETKADIPANQSETKPSTPADVTPYRAKREMIYDMFFRGRKAGHFQRTETYFHDGRIEVINDSITHNKKWLHKITTTNYSKSMYDREGQLQSFEIESREAYGRAVRFKGQRDAKGLHISRQVGKYVKNVFTAQGVEEKKSFPLGAFQGTSLDLRIPAGYPGISIYRAYLVIPKMEIIDQQIEFRQAPPNTGFQHLNPHLEVVIQNDLGKAMFLIDQQGQMLASRTNSPFGLIEIRIRQPSSILQPK
jgi:hypothetical protein